MSTVALAPIEPEGTSEERYVSTMRALSASIDHDVWGDTWIDRLDDEGLVQFGMNDCEALDRGSHPGNLMEANIAAADEFDPWSLDEGLYHQGIYVASGSLCPRHEEAVHSFYDDGLPIPGASPDFHFDGMADDAAAIWIFRSEPPEPDYSLFYDSYETIVAEFGLAAEQLSQYDAQKAADQICDRLTDLEPIPDVVTATKDAVADQARILSVGNQHALILTVVAVGGVCPEDTHVRSHRVFEAIGYVESHPPDPEQDTDE